MKAEELYLEIRLKNTVEFNGAINFDTIFLNFGGHQYPLDIINIHGFAPNEECSDYRIISQFISDLDALETYKGHLNVGEKTLLDVLTSDEVQAAGRFALEADPEGYEVNAPNIVSIELKSFCERIRLPVKNLDAA
ncbi:hypothetical protein [Vibrio barjaei]|uniref:hypothetical protein n=1 Tax=Vibrio barjaei TaxID=1676683 RepID=UPI0022844F38|nr:hypothetical protein [Vibrio barjaei]MCY9870462.1 hypothetical protein [Vibrio barjaei]